MTARTETTGMDILDKIKAMQKRAIKSGKHGYSSVLAEAAKEIDALRVKLAQSPGGYRL